MKNFSSIKQVSKSLVFLISSTALAGQTPHSPAHRTSTGHAQTSRVEATTGTTDSAPEVVYAKQWMKLAVKRAKGQWSAQVRNTYLHKVRKEMLDKLKISQKVLIAETLAWVDNTPHAKQAVYGAIYPADERILLNLDTLRKELGTELFEKHSNLCIGAAVARRKLGLGVIQAGINKFSELYKQADSLIAAGTDPETYFATPIPVGEVDTENVSYKAIENYLDEQDILPRQAYDDITHRTAMEELLGGKHRLVPKMLSRWLIAHGKRSNKRRPTPRVSEYIKYLDSILSIPAEDLNLTKGQRWPLFPVVTTPWPILMPLSKTWPLDEARYIFEKYQGLHDGSRYQAYGPYNKYPKGVSASLEPSDEWNNGAWPLISKSGGLCGTMSTIANGTMTSLGIPMLKATQPGHSNIVTYSLNMDGQYLASPGQSISTPANTKTHNLFNDIHDPLVRAGSFSHHLAMTMAMNVGLGSYMDVRIALHLYKALTANSQINTKALKLVRNALEFNPYHLEAWLTVVQDNSPAELLITFERFIHLHKVDAVFEEPEVGNANADLGDDEVNQNTSADSSIALLNDLGLQMMWEIAVLDIRQHSSEELQGLFELISTEVDNGQPSLHVVLDSLRCLVKGETVAMNALKDDISVFLSTPPENAETYAEQRQARKKRILAIRTIVARAENLRTFVEDSYLFHESMTFIMDQFTDAEKGRIDGKNRLQMTQLYAGICEVYSRLLNKAEKTALLESYTALAVRLRLSEASEDSTTEDPAIETVGE